MVVTGESKGQKGRVLEVDRDKEQSYYRRFESDIKTYQT